MADHINIGTRAYRYTPMNIHCCIVLLVIKSCEVLVRKTSVMNALICLAGISTCGRELISTSTPYTISNRYQKSNKVNIFACNITAKKILSTQKYIAESSYYALCYYDIPN